jgi:predicted metal-dependent hydrolase
MPSIRIGQTEITYELQRTAAASERRITVTPGRVEVLALATDNEAAIEGFLDRKRQWLFDTVRQVEEIAATRPAVPRFMTGSKIPYRGRKVALTVRRHDGARVAIAYRGGLIVDLPSHVPAAAAGAIVAMEIKFWLKQQARRDILDIAKVYGQWFDLKR